MIISEVVTLFFYVISIAFLPEYFGICFRFIVFLYQLTDFLFCDLPFLTSHTHTHINRPLFRRDPRVCLESCCNSRDQRDATLDSQDGEK